MPYRSRLNLAIVSLRSCTGWITIMLDSLHIKNFRCFEDLKIDSLGYVNLIVGKNNTGKTTLLDSVHLFAQRGRFNVIFDILNARREFFYSQASPMVNLKQIESLFFNRKAIGDSSSIYIGNNSRLNKLTLGFVDVSDVRYGSSLGLKVTANSNELIIEPSKFDKEIISIINFQEAYNSSRVTSNLDNDPILNSIWDGLKISRRSDLILDALKIIDEKIEDVFFTRESIAMLGLSSQDVAIPVRSMGEGMSRLLQIFLHAFDARQGYLMIDEFENGLHYSIQEEVWDKIFKLAKELDIQVFATTHSQDTVKSFSKVALESPEEGRLISLGRNEWDKENKKISALVYSEDEIRVISETGMDVR